MTRKYGGFIWEKAFHWCEVEREFSVPDSQFPILRSQSGEFWFPRTANWELLFGYQGVGTLSFRAHTIYLGA